jgi:FKBP-type peptidyl-prolyl cis-trans isomerase
MIPRDDGRRREPTKPRVKKRSGVKILEDVLGMGEKVQRHRWYRLTLRAWLHNRKPVVWREPFGLCDRGSHISHGGRTMTADFRYDRVFLIAGLFYGIEGMRIGGKRTLKISPHLAYRDRGIEGVIPPNATLEIEVKIHEERTEF